MWSVSKVYLVTSTTAVAQSLGDDTALRCSFTASMTRKAFATREQILIELEK